MTMNQQDRDALSQNWESAKSQIKIQFPDVTDDDLASGQPDQVVSTIATRTGQDPKQVEQTLKSVAQQFGGGQSQGQTRS